MDDIKLSIFDKLDINSKICFIKTSKNNHKLTERLFISIADKYRSLDHLSKFNSLNFIIFKHNNKIKFEYVTYKAINNAAQNGHLDVVKWLHHHRSEGCTTHAIDYAAQNGHLDVVKWLHHHRSEGCTTDAMNHAARNGHLEVVKWLHDNKNYV